MENIYVLGDIHGRWNVIENVIYKAGCRDGYIIQVGDFGAGFYSPQKEEEKLFPISELLLDRNLELLVIRGNHDKPDLFDNTSILPAINYLQDYTIKNLAGKNFLFVGGAVSLDRAQRVPYVDYWYDEVFKNRSLDSWYGGEKIDVVITHNVPTVAGPELRITSPMVQSQSKHDPGLIKALTSENKKLDELYSQIKSVGGCECWYYGHFHSSDTTYVEGTKFVMLNINEIQMVRCNN